MNNASLEEKIDQILTYQKSARRWAMLRGITSFLFFLIFVVLPLVASFYLADYLKKNVDWSKFGDMKAQFEQLREMSGMEQILREGLPKTSPQQ